ncbi:demethylmenaquinone methyltransferase [Lactobacillus terrae]|uniref:demethylmenaquinone methyltransferase n=1 Tax=Lactobacillus terrae TaxID=2269374 RepID=UPI000C1B6EE2|nr:demethylmenaquinone methyltransferase [Lactobacillus terrae]
MAITNKTPTSDVRDIFNEVAKNYDRMNNVITLGMQKKWRKKSMLPIDLTEGQIALDVCCGTGDWTIELAKLVGPSGHVYGVDISSEMIEIARRKIIKQGLEDRITLIEGDAMNLPVEENYFDVATIGFGLRNVPDAQAVLQEMKKAVHENGKVVCLETSKPDNLIVKPLWKMYFAMVPIFSKLLVNNYDNYAYLKNTAEEFLSADQLSNLFSEINFKNVEYQKLFFGAAAVHTGTK